MDHPKTLIDFNTFIGQPRTSVYAIGVRASVHIPKAMLGVRGVIVERAIASGDATRYHMPETDLYPPIVAILGGLLPFAAIIDKTALLKQLSNPLLRTDLSVRKLEHVNNERLGDHNFAAVIEVKSVFHGESVAEKDLLVDLEKLVECERVYGAKCFFALVGLEADLKRCRKSLTKLGLDNAIGPIPVVLASGKTAWLLPSARHVEGSPQVFIWTVSSNRTFAADASQYVFTVFQAA
ncbi:hypothetical protein [Bordetella sp. N]|uniref:hypothetical protein n=1 Tax=Bordetella sp. N TaxID=1746199 RepID=UPI0012E348EB|nr:hypothetical protein [Bordetella sp. N]